MGQIGGAVYADPQNLGAINRSEREARPERIISGSVEDDLFKRFCGDARP